MNLSFTFSGSRVGDLSNGLISDPVLVENMFHGAIVVCIFGSADLDGTVSLEVSVDPGQSSPGVLVYTGINTWVEIAGSATDVTGDENILFDLGSIPYKYIRLVYTRTSGSGHIQSVINADRMA